MTGLIWPAFNDTSLSSKDKTFETFLNFHPAWKVHASLNDEMLLESRVEPAGSNGGGEEGLHWLCLSSQV